MNKNSGNLSALFLALSLLTGSCGKIELKTDANDHFHVRVEGTELPVLVRGNTSAGKLIVFVNGGPGLSSLDVAEGNLLGWDESLSPEYGIVYYDQRGTGNAQGNFDPASISAEQYLRDLDQILQVVRDQYDDPQLYLMAHSFGAYIAARFLMDPDRKSPVDGLIAVDGSFALRPIDLWVHRRQFLIDVAGEMLLAGQDTSYWREALDWAVAHPIVETAEEKDQWRRYIGFPGGRVLPEEPYDISAGTIFKLLFASSYNLFPAYLSDNLMVTGRALIDEVGEDNLLPQLKNIDLPSLFIWGKYDDLIPASLGREAFDSLGTPTADKSYLLFGESGHQPFLNQPEEFAESVLDFVRRH